MNSIEPTQTDIDAADEHYPPRLWRKEARDDLAKAFAVHRRTAQAELVEALDRIDKQVSHGKMGDWNLALTAIREIARAALSKYSTDATKGTDNGG